MENKQRALFMLTYALRETRAGKDVAFVDVIDGGDTAKLVLFDGSEMTVNIACDSAIAAIIDVCKALM